MTFENYIRLWGILLSNLILEKCRSLISVPRYHSSLLSQFSCFALTIILHGAALPFLHEAVDTWGVRNKIKIICGRFEKNYFFTYSWGKERERNEYHLKQWRHDNERDGRSQDGGEATALHRRKLMAKARKLCSHISQGRFMKVLLFRVGGKWGGRNIYNVLLLSPHPILPPTPSTSRVPLVRDSAPNFLSRFSCSHLETHCCNFLVWDLHATEVYSALISVWNVKQWLQKLF